MNDQNTAKQKAGEHAIKFIESGMTIGIGTGSTIFYFIQALAKKIKEGLLVRGVPTSKQTAQLAKELNIPLIELNDVSQLDLTVDGADEIDAQLQLIKGGGGALLQEKIVAAASKKLVIIADETKLVDTLGKFPLPVEVITFAWKQTQRHIQELGCNKIVLRTKDEIPFITDHGHCILDCYFEKIDNAALLQQQLNNIPGVVENGLFINMATNAIVAYNDGSVKEITK